MTRRWRSPGWTRAGASCARASSTATASRIGCLRRPPVARTGEVAGFWYRKKVRRDRDLHRFSVDTKYFTGRKLDLGLDHHLCHMASAYYCADVEEAVIVSVDGVGDLLSAVIGRGAGTEIRVDARYFQSEHISGQAYEVVTAMLGFHPDKHPGKVTGLAAYSSLLTNSSRRSIAGSATSTPAARARIGSTSSIRRTRNASSPGCASCGTRGSAAGAGRRSPRRSSTCSSATS